MGAAETPRDPGLDDGRGGGGCGSFDTGAARIGSGTVTCGSSLGRISFGDGAATGFLGGGSGSEVCAVGVVSLASASMLMKLPSTTCLVASAG
jgi:hypothetical protein